MKIDREDLLKALDLLEESKLQVAYSLGTIENDVHGAHPIGRGVSVTLHNIKTPAMVWQKGLNFCDAMQRAIVRAAGAVGR